MKSHVVAAFITPIVAIAAKWLLAKLRELMRRKMRDSKLKRLLLSEIK